MPTGATCATTTPTHVTTRRIQEPTNGYVKFWPPTPCCATHTAVTNMTALTALTKTPAQSGYPSHTATPSTSSHPYGQDRHDGTADQPTPATQLNTVPLTVDQNAAAPTGYGFTRATTCIRYAQNPCLIKS